MVTYFFHSNTRNEVKIGRTGDLTKTEKTLHRACPDGEMVHSINGDIEAGLHERFKKYRVHPRHEWFRHEGELKSYLEKFSLVMRTKKIVRLVREKGYFTCDD